MKIDILHRPVAIFLMFLTLLIPKGVGLANNSDEPADANLLGSIITTKSGQASNTRRCGEKEFKSGCFNGSSTIEGILTENTLAEVINVHDLRAGEKVLQIKITRTCKEDDRYRDYVTCRVANRQNRSVCKWELPGTFESCLYSTLKKGDVTWIKYKSRLKDDQQYLELSMDRKNLDNNYPQTPARALNKNGELETVLEDNDQMLVDKKAQVRIGQGVEGMSNPNLPPQGNNPKLESAEIESKRQAAEAAEEDAKTEAGTKETAQCSVDNTKYCADVKDLSKLTDFIHPALGIQCSEAGNACVGNTTAKCTQAKSEFKSSVYLLHQITDKCNEKKSELTFISSSGSAERRKLCSTDYVQCLRQGSCRDKSNRVYTVESVEKGRFKQNSCKYGKDVTGNCVVPFYSVAASRTKYPAGTVLYIPKVVGLKLPDGSSHTGYFTVTDIGGNIKNNRLDFNIGDVQDYADPRQNPFARRDIDMITPNPPAPSAADRRRPGFVERKPNDMFVVTNPDLKSCVQKHHKAQSDKLSR